MATRPTLDLFCRVIDNYGDIGVCWRLARQLAAEHAMAVRLFVDDLQSFRFISPDIDPAAPRQSLIGVEVLQWALAETLPPAGIVVEAFACDPPARYIAAMAEAEQKPVWLNLEYLSAESWVDEVHGRPSPHPRLPLVKYFFCPGFTERSGGLIREAGVAAWSLGNAAADTDFLASRAEVQWDATEPHPHPNPPLEGEGTPHVAEDADFVAGGVQGEWDATEPHPHPNPPLEGEGTPQMTTRQAAEVGSSPVKGEARRGMGFPSPTSHILAPTPTSHILSPTPTTGNRELKLFAFTYPDAPVAAVARALTQAGHTITVATAARLTHPPAESTALDPVPQPAFDALLSRFDLLLVRGEDSFVRAQWAGKPMFWHIYPTEDQAHLVKLDAWLDRNCDGLADDAALAYRSASHAFVRGLDDPAAFAAWASHLATLALHAQAWRTRLLQQADLATRLVRFIALVKKEKVG